MYLDPSESMMRRLVVLAGTGELRNLIAVCQRLTV